MLRSPLSPNRLEIAVASELGQAIKFASRGQPAATLAKRYVLQVALNRLAAQCSRRARRGRSPAGWASTLRQRRWRSCSTLSRQPWAP